MWVDKQSVQSLNGYQFHVIFRLKSSINHFGNKYPQQNTIGASQKVKDVIKNISSRDND